jgi:hypothetical protein
VRLELRPSPALAAAIIAAHAAAGIAVLLLMPDFFGAALGAALLALGTAAAWSRALLRGPDALRALEISKEGAACELGSGLRMAVAAARRRYVSRLLVTLPVRGRALLVTADMLEPREFRRLRIWALWGKVPAVAREQLAG